MAKQPREVLLVSRARRQLMEATSIHEVLSIRDKAEALRAYQKQQQDSFEAQNMAAEIKVRAERRAGELLREMDKAKGGRPSNGKTSDSVSPVLADLGIHKKQSSRWQTQAEVPEKEFDEYIAEQKAEQREITSADLIRKGKRHQRHKKQTEKKPKPEQSGDQVELPECKVICGDCLTELKKLSGVRCIFADPPYNIGVDYGSGHDDKLDPGDYLDWCRSWIRACCDVLTDDGSLWVMINDEWAADFALEFQDAGLTRRAWIKWYETFGVNCSNNFNRTSRHIFYCVMDAKQFVFNHEPITTQSQRQAVYKDRRADHHGKLWDDVWFISRVTGTSKERIPDFPTQVPEAITDAIVQVATVPGDLVVDPFSGSGTMGVSCRRHGRLFIGIERNQDFADKSLVRIQTTDAKTPV